MSLNDLLNLFSLFTPLLAAKVFLLTFALFYSVFATVVLRQTQLMLRILDETSFSPFLKLLAIVHFLAAIVVFILAFILLLF